jgi:hypothetical protein
MEDEGALRRRRQEAEVFFVNLATADVSPFHLKTGRSQSGLMSAATMVKAAHGSFHSMRRTGGMAMTVLLVNPPAPSLAGRTSDTGGLAGVVQAP